MYNVKIISIFMPAYIEFWSYLYSLLKTDRKSTVEYVLDFGIPRITISYISGACIPLCHDLPHLIWTYLFLLPYRSLKFGRHTGHRDAAPISEYFLVWLNIPSRWKRLLLPRCNRGRTTPAHSLLPRSPDQQSKHIQVNRNRNRNKRKGKLLQDKFSN